MTVIKQVAVTFAAHMANLAHARQSNHREETDAVIRLP